MLELIGSVFDQMVNRALGNYVGFQPRRPHELIIPRFVVIRRDGWSLTEQLDQFINPKVLARPAVVADEVTWRIVGEQLTADLESAGHEPRKVFIGSNRFSEVESVVRTLSRRPRMWADDVSVLDRRLYAPKRVSVVFAVGGGTVIDVSKLVARQLHVPCISIPTSLANDGIASPFAVIDPGAAIPGLAQVTVRTNTPLGILVGLPYIKASGEAANPFFVEMLRSGIGDIVSNITAVMDWELAARVKGDSLDYPALLQARSAGEVVVHRVAEGCALDGDEFLLTLAAALISSGEAMTRVGSSRPASGFEHKFYHAFRNLLKFPSPASHGVLVAVGTLISSWCHGRSFDVIRAAFAAAGLPVDLSGLEEYAIEPEQAIGAVEAAVEIKPERYTILEELGSEALVRSFREVYGWQR